MRNLLFDIKKWFAIVVANGKVVLSYPSSSQCTTTINATAHRFSPSIEWISWNFPLFLWMYFCYIAVLLYYMRCQVGEERSYFVCMCEELENLASINSYFVLMPYFQFYRSFFALIRQKLFLFL